MKKQLLFLPAAIITGIVLLFAAPFATAQLTQVIIHGGTYDLVHPTVLTGTANTPAIDTSSITSSNMVAGVAADGATGIFDLGTIKISGTTTKSDGELTGFVFRGTGPFSGSIDGSDITVTATDTAGYGTYFRGTGGNNQSGGLWADISGSVGFGTLKVTASGTGGTDAGAAGGFVAGTLINGANVTLAGVDITAGYWGLGVKLDAVEANSTINAGIVEISAGGNGTGILIGDLVNDVPAHSAGGNAATMGLTAGTIKASSINVDSGWNASGILISQKMTGGEIEVTGGITAISSGNRAVGIGMFDGVAGGNVTVNGDIVVDGVNEAAGFAALNSGLAAGSTVALKKITVTEQNVEAAGVRFTGNVAGTLTTGDISVASENGRAYGVHVAQGGIANNANATTFGKISVESGSQAGLVGLEPTAAGIWTNGDSTFTLTGNIDVKGVDYNAYGIIVEGDHDANITIDAGKTVNIAASGAMYNVGIEVGRNLNLDIPNGATLETNAVWVGSDMNVSGGGTFNSTDWVDVSSGNLNVSGSNTIANLYGQTFVDTLNVSNGAKVSSVRMMGNQMVGSGSLYVITTTI